MAILPEYRYGKGPIIEETAFWILYAPDKSTDPGYDILEPKWRKGNKNIWTRKILAMLQQYSSPQNIYNAPKPDVYMTFQPDHKYSYDYKDGTVRVDLDTNTVSIQEAHPRRTDVITDLIKLWFESKQKNSALKVPIEVIRYID